MATSKKFDSLVSLGTKKEKSIKEKNVESQEVIPEAEDNKPIDEVDELEEPKQPIPEPEKSKYRDTFRKVNYGVGDTNVRLPLSLHQILKKLSVHENSTINQIVANLVSDFLEKHDKEVKKSLRS